MWMLLGSHQSPLIKVLLPSLFAESSTQLIAAPLASIICAGLRA
jgi:hypothetical protein